MTRTVKNATGRDGGNQRGPLSEGERASILAWHDEGMGRNEIANRLGRSAGTVSRIVKEAGGTFDTTATAVATAVRVNDLNAVRVEIEGDTLQKLRGLIAAFDQPDMLVQWDSQGSTFAFQPLNTPTIKAKADLARAAKDLAQAAKFLADANKEATSGEGGDIDTVEAFLVHQVDQQATTAALAALPRRTDDTTTNSAP